MKKFLNLELICIVAAAIHTVYSIITGPTFITEKDLLIDLLRWKYIALIWILNSLLDHFNNRNKS